MGGWQKYAVCKCGSTYRAPFGDKFHIHREVCSECGSPKSTWRLVTGRWVSYGFLWLSSRFEELEDKDV